MCRLYGFHANEETKVECSLVHAQNALMLQSRADLRGRAHPHGWGLAFYTDSTPTVVRQATAAYEDLHFSATAEGIYTRTVVAHVRYATVGTPSLLNSHPFSHGVWTFAHNGTVAGFAELRTELQRETLPELQHYRGGDTDSEQAFYWVLSRLAAAGIGWGRPCDDIAKTADALSASVLELAERCAGTNPPQPPKLNFLLTDGRNLLATRWNNSLHWLTRNGIRDCEICGIPHVHHDSRVHYRAVAVASEPVTHEEWREVPEGHIVCVDETLNTSVTPLRSAA